MDADFSRANFGTQIGAKIRTSDGFAEAQYRKRLEITLEWCRKAVSHEDGALSTSLFNY